MDVQDLEIYQSAMEMGDRIWSIVLPWKKFEKDTVGTQMVRAADSIAANLSEGYGRYHFGENRQFCYYARGSLHELRTWLKKSERRGLITKSVFNELDAALNLFGRRLNAYIASIGKISNKPTPPALTTDPDYQRLVSSDPDPMTTSVSCPVTNDPSTTSVQ